ncbi:protein of unknown function [Ruaniaceae bacterium KH17]|nr:protein of unknown function [Ruaniaceae bacterium KH17]
MASQERLGQQVAEAFRCEHGLGVQPLGDLAALIERTTGHDVAILDAPPDEHGLTMRDPERGRVFVGVARTLNPMRQRSSLAHELAHLVFGDSAQALGERTPVEIRADAFARHLLIPVEGLKGFLGAPSEVDSSRLSDVVQWFLVSPAVAAIQMRDAGYVEPELATAWMKLSTAQLATRFGWSDYYATLQADSDRLRAPQGLLARAIRGYEFGVVGAQAIATLRGRSVEEVLAELDEAGIRQISPEAAEFEAHELPVVNVDLSGLEDLAGDS